mmetsp:Transcript_98488/g.279087  ORF Transcript_98488/g.279087 Transcript_98488/m.279087 type:complete len:87 (+) Transcript_98488:83-343(+)|eukprot:CAMPEP_0179279800 /NCGR_PEP_ID=MMETSP0797-20121207/36301_1 /TAXON_ID=47934 /ORGANISM="Dinophysis acuminata, Strain DAEP01" /LENGTH=86 /DNA_ID=CAMNT_0020988441 /DNA_START=83 /DNA_END=343 /DNA_ORIENTATION=+
MASITLDTNDLDAEELQLLAEIKAKGYYHGRPKSDPTPQPQRIDVNPPSDGANQKRTDFDEYQRKWEKFQDDKLIGKLERGIGTRA